MMNAPDTLAFLSSAARNVLEQTTRFLADTLTILREDGCDAEDLREDTAPLLVTLQAAAAACLAAPDARTMRAELEAVYTWSGRVRDCAIRALDARPR